MTDFKMSDLSEADVNTLMMAVMQTTIENGGQALSADEVGKLAKDAGVTVKESDLPSLTADINAILTDNGMLMVPKA